MRRSCWVNGTTPSASQRETRLLFARRTKLNASSHSEADIMDPNPLKIVRVSNRPVNSAIKQTHIFPWLCCGVFLDSFGEIGSEHFHLLNTFVVPHCIWLVSLRSPIKCIFIKVGNLLRHIVLFPTAGHSSALSTRHFQVGGSTQWVTVQLCI